MVFSSTLFLFVFFPITLTGYYLLRGQFKNYWLLFVSIIFFAWSQPKYLSILFLSILINYFCARLIARNETFRKPILTIAILADLSILFYYKYFNFTINTINKILGSDFTTREIILPIGISFFTFQGISYVIDVYRKDVPVQKSLLKTGLFITLFPQLIAGPIVRYKDIAPEIDKRHVTIDAFCSGIERFILGLGKKAVVANTMAALVDPIWQNGPENNSWVIAWIGSIAYTLQIYYDFSGYSDMAIGLGRMFGFHFCENFDLPYISNSISEFWRRWHKSLSSWFRDYVYIPLGGSRKHVYRNLIVIFLLTGIWHGASWHFLVWGIWNGLFIVVERVVKNKTEHTSRGSSNMKNIRKTILAKCYTLFIINIGWIIFRAQNTSEAIRYIIAMFRTNAPNRTGFTVFWFMDRWTTTIMILGLIFASSFPTSAGRWIRTHVPEKTAMILKYILLLVVLYLSMIRIVSGTYNPFIYFQF